MKTKHITKIVVAFITSGVALAGIVYQTNHSSKETVETQEKNEDEVVNDAKNNNYLNGRTEKSDTDIVQMLQEENSDLKGQLEDSQKVRKQKEKEISQYESENTYLTDELEKVNLELKQTKEENEAFLSESNDRNKVEFLDQQIYVEGSKIPGSSNAIASINGSIYYSDETVEKILERYGTEYSYSDTGINIQKNIDATKLSLSRAEVYEKDDSVSTGSGIREDIEGDQFSGILFRSYGGISFLVNEKYEKMSGVIHIARETASNARTRIQVIIYDKDGNEKTVFESKELTALANEQTFSDEGDLDIKGAKIVRIEQQYIDGKTEAVISDAFFYNE